MYNKSIYGSTYYEGMYYVGTTTTHNEVAYTIYILITSTLKMFILATSEGRQQWCYHQMISE